MKHYETELKLGFAKYPNNRLAMQLFEKETDDLYAMATINLPNEELADDEVIIKNYSENKGILPMLEKAGIVKRTERTVYSGFISAHVCKLLIDTKDEKTNI